MRLVVFVVAADEGWKPQSEEHLAILDLLGVDGAIVALTKSDLAEPAAVEATIREVHDRLRGTALSAAPLIPCSARTGEGIDDLVAAIDEMVSSATVESDGTRPRLFVDRVFTIKGAGTVVTGTLAGGSLAVGDDVAVYPSGRKTRIRGLQSHKRSVERADPTSRVAVNLSGIEPSEIARGDMLGLPDSWMPTELFEAQLKPVRDLAHPLTSRGAFKLYAGSMERDAAIRFYSDPAEGAFARVRLSSPATLAVFDHVVIRESGRSETVAGGMVLDISPPSRPGRRAIERLAARLAVAPNRADLATRLLDERGAVRTSDLTALAGVNPPQATQGWLVAPDLQRQVTSDIAAALTEFHRENPLKQGADLELVRRTVETRLARSRAPRDQDLIEQMLEFARSEGHIVKEGSSVRLPTHSSAAGGPELDSLIEAVRQGGPTPPTTADLLGMGFQRDLVEAACNSGTLVRISPALVMDPEFVAAAQRTLASLEPITVSSFREALGTSRKYALPLLEYFDRKGVTTRRGDVRTVRS